MHSKQRKTRTAAPVQESSFGSKKKKDGAVSFEDNRSETLQLKKLQDSAQTAPVQFVKPKPLSEMLVDRAGKDTDHGRETKSDIEEAVDPDVIALRLYRQARDHDFGIQQLPAFNDGLNNAVNGAIALVREAVNESKVLGKSIEAEEAGYFDSVIKKKLRGNSNAANVAKYFYQKVLNQAKAEEYLKNLVHQDQNFDFGFEGDEGVQYETPKAGLLGPDQTDLDIGTSIANRVLSEAFQSASQEEIYFRLAVAIRETMNSPNVSLDIASRILENYLKPKLMNFIYRIPLAEQMDDEDVWNGRTLNDGILDAQENDFDEDDTWIRPKVRDAWTQIRDIVSPAVLNHAGPAHVQVDGWFTRAHQNSGVIHLGKYVATKGIIMHEFGHHLENNSEAPRWIKLQQLMRNRSQGKDLKRIFPFTIPYVISSDEMRYDTDLPASGEMGGYFGYNVKYYEHGSTEVVSTAFEVFHDRDKAYRIAIKDPEMFLAVMGVLRGR
ncbi:hypothetical protein [Fluviicola sp.]|uniref:hypothetical protein n=1 Tax=Fluviicola sp. TaxID=1917219 RepID=UPI0031CF984E